MSEKGVIRHWREDDGCGVIDAPSTPGGCWAHFSALTAASFWQPLAGEQVNFEFESFMQDGFAYRATCVWLSDPSP